MELIIGSMVAAVLSLFGHLATVLGPHFWRRISLRLPQRPRPPPPKLVPVPQD